MFVGLQPVLRAMGPRAILLARGLFAVFDRLPTVLLLMRSAVGFGLGGLQSAGDVPPAEYQLLVRLMGLPLQGRFRSFLTLVTPNDEGRPTARAVFACVAKSFQETDVFLYGRAGIPFRKGLPNLASLLVGFRGPRVAVRNGGLGNCRVGTFSIIRGPKAAVTHRPTARVGLSSYSA